MFGGDVAPYALVGGNPARHVRSRFPEPDVALLLEARWWDRPIEAVTEHAALIMGGAPADLAAVARGVRG